MDHYNKFPSDYPRLLHQLPPSTPSTPTLSSGPATPVPFGAGGLLNSDSSSSSLNSNYYLHPTLRYQHSPSHYRYSGHAYNGIGPPMSPSLSPSPHYQLYQNYGRYGYSPYSPYSNNNYFNSREISAYYHHRHHHRNHYDSYGRIIGSSSSSSTDGLIAHGYQNGYSYDPIAGMHQAVRNSGLPGGPFYSPARDIDYSITHHHPQPTNHSTSPYPPIGDTKLDRYPLGIHKNGSLKDNDSFVSQLTEIVESPETPTLELRQQQIECQREDHHQQLEHHQQLDHQQHLEHHHQLDLERCEMEQEHLKQHRLEEQHREQECHDQACNNSLTINLSSPTGSNPTLNDLSFLTEPDNSNNHNKSAGSNLHSDNIDSTTTSNDKSALNSSNINEPAANQANDHENNEKELEIKKNENNDNSSQDDTRGGVVEDITKENSVEKIDNETEKIDTHEKEKLVNETENNKNIESENEKINCSEKTKKQLNENNQENEKKTVQQQSIDSKENKPRIKIVQSREKLTNQLKSASNDKKTADQILAENTSINSPSFISNQSSNPFNSQRPGNAFPVQHNNSSILSQQHQQQRCSTPYLPQHQQQQQRSTTPFVPHHQQTNNNFQNHMQAKFPNSSPGYNPNYSPYHHNGYPYSNGSNCSNWSSPYSSPNYSWSPHQQQPSPQHRYHFSPPLTKLSSRKRSFSPISQHPSNPSFKTNGSTNKILESDFVPNKKVKRKLKSDQSTVKDEIRSENKDIKPLPGFQQAFGSTEIGRFSETFLNTPSSSLGDNYYSEYESEADTSASPYPWEAGDSLEGPHYNLHVGASVQSIYSNSSDNYGSPSIDDNSYFSELRCNDY